MTVFFKAVTKVVGNLQKETSSFLPQVTVNEAVTQEYFFIKTNKKIVRIAFNDVLFIEALQKYIRIHLTDKRVVSLFSLSKIQELLPAHQFIRIHRSYLINIDKVDSVEGNMVKIDKHIIPVSKGQKEAFMDLLKRKGLFY